MLTLLFQTSLGAAAKSNLRPSTPIPTKPYLQGPLLEPFWDNGCSRWEWGVCCCIPESQGDESCLFPACILAWEMMGVWKHHGAPHLLVPHGVPCPCRGHSEELRPSSAPRGCGACAELGSGRGVPAASPGQRSGEEEPSQRLYIPCCSRRSYRSLISDKGATGAAAAPGESRRRGGAAGSSSRSAERGDGAPRDPARPGR